MTKGGKFSALVVIPYHNQPDPFVVDYFLVGN
jgi:hypothetical protein